MKALFRFVKEHFAAIFFAAVFIWSAVAISLYRAAEAPPGAIVLRLGHWQLESSVRDAFNQLAADYRREVNPKVYVVQDAIPEGNYGQWASSQLMGGTAPDLLEIWKGLPYPIWVSYLGRYFVPLTQEVNKPNHYNKGTDLEKKSLEKTYLNGMRTAYVEEIQEYMMVPLSQFTVRVFYNRDLYTKLTGKPKPSSVYREFIADCEKIKAQKDPKGRPYVPIACSTFHFNQWEGMVCDPPTYAALQKADFNRDGYLGNDELFVAVRAGRLSLESPPFKAKFDILHQLASEFNSGYTGLGRDEALFLFAQSRAVFMSTGTWDARSLQEQAEGFFHIGVMNFPSPGPDDPQFGSLIDGPVLDKPMVGIDMAINRGCKYPEVALDFLRYLSSRKGNEKFNQIVGWIPAIKGAKVPDFLRGFEPHTEGIYGAMNTALGGETAIRWNQLYSLFQLDQISYHDMIRQFEPFYRANGMKDYREVAKDWRRNISFNEQFLTGVRAKAWYTTDQGEAASVWVKYRSLIGSRQVFPEIGHARQFQLIENLPDKNAAGPYEYSSKVLAKVKAGLAKGN